MNEFDELLKQYLQNLVFNEKPESGGKKQFSGYIEGEKEYNSFMVDLKALGFLFSTENSNQNKSSRIVFSFEQKNADIRIPFFGSPFQVVKSIYMVCAQGGTSEPKKPPKPVLSDHPLTKKPRTRNKLSKKTGCPAFMTVKCLRVFTEECYRATAYKRGSTENTRIMEKLNRDLHDAAPPPLATLRYLLLLSPADDHNHPVAAANLNHRLDPRLREAIHSYARLHPRSVEAVRDHLSRTVDAMFGGEGGPRPHPHNRCYYPVDKVIRFHMNQAASNVQNDLDQGALGRCVEGWSSESPGDRFFYRPYRLPGGGGGRGASEAPPSTLLFCHQTGWQRRLLRRYGNDLALLDPAYKTLKYSFPLFFLVVRTNAGACIAGTFVVQRETAVLVEEALSTFKAWNPDWEPEYFLADNAEANVTALERTFPRTAVFTCPFHRRQAWERWLAKKGNARKRCVGDVLASWIALAASPTEEDYGRNLERACEVPNARRYLETDWLPVRSAWVECDRPRRLAWLVAAGDGVAGADDALRHDVLARLGDATLSGVVRGVVEGVVPEAMREYSVANVPVGGREYDVTVPEFLRDRPIPFVEGVMTRLDDAGRYDPSLINHVGDGVFLVRSEPASDEWCSVDFREAECSCEDFARCRIPCVHMCAVFLNTDWTFDRLPPSYTGHPYLAVDPDPIAGDDEAIEAMEATEVESIESLMEATRDRLRALHGYTYLQGDAERAARFAGAVASLEAEMSDEAHRTVGGLSLGPNDSIVPVGAVRFLPVRLGQLSGCGEQGAA